MDKRVYISRNYKSINSAGGKAKTDIEKAIQSVGYRNIGLRQTNSTNKIIDFTRNLLGIVKAVFCMPRNGILLLQYPMKKYYSLLCKAAHLKNTKVITVIHDLGTFRRKKLTVEKEINRLKNSDCIIAQNPSMYKWLEENGYKGKLSTLEIFDYLSDKQNKSEIGKGKDDSYIVNYAGALSRKKNGFLYQLAPTTYDFHLYGNGFQPENENKRFVYHGFQKSDDLIYSMKGDFGLVWDGDSIETCSGNYGLYLKYNSPHKISFYVRCHLPVIIWNQAAMAPFIEKNNIGFAISSLTELDELLKNIDTEKYIQLKNNTIELSRQLSTGFFIKKALTEAEEKLS